MFVRALSGDERHSSPGSYAGFNPPCYDGWLRTSQYVAMPDGILLAVDVYRPSANGVICDIALPAIFAPHRYMRAYETPSGKLCTAVDEVNGFSNFLRHGYCMVVWDPRGAGASFGEYYGLVSSNEVDDAVFVLEWIVAQPWCDGNVGMFGRSYSGNMQHVVASRRPRGLKALFPAVSLFDAYDTIFPGGVFRPVVAERMPLLLSSDMGEDVVFTRGLPARTDDDPDAILRDEALAQHRVNPRHLSLMCEQWRNASEGPYRDGTYYDGQRYFIDDTDFGPVNPAARLTDIATNNIPTYFFGGWYDGFTSDTFRWFMNVPGPKKIIMGPWAHAEGIGAARRNAGLRYERVESLRWFDYWLKGIDNGIMAEPAASIAICTDVAQWQWIEADSWPLQDVIKRTFYCTSENHGNVSENRLANNFSMGGPDEMSFTVDYSATTGRASRWYGLTAVAVEYPDMASQDCKGLSFTSPEIADGLMIVGTPVFEMRVRSSEADGDFVVLLEEVDYEGRSNYLSEGVLRASFRDETCAPYKTETGIYHPGTRQSVDSCEKLNEDFATLRIELLPIGHTIAPNNRLRITIQGSDADNLATLRFDPPPVISIDFRREGRARLMLPVVDGATIADRGDVAW